MAVLPPLKVRRHIPIIIYLSLLFTKDIKEGHTIESNSWIDRKVANFVIQTHHIPVVGVLVLVLIIFYIEGVIDKGVNWCGRCWDVDGELVSIYVEVSIYWTGDAGNGGYTTIGALDWFFYDLETINIFYFN